MRSRARHLRRRHMLLGGLGLTLVAAGYASRVRGDCERLPAAAHCAGGEAADPAWAPASHTALLSVSAGGRLVRSRDGGRGWQEVELPGAPELRGLLRVDAATLVAVGVGGVMLRSTDDGRQWQPVGVGLSHQSLLTVLGCGAGCVLALGHEGDVLRSVDGGQRWQRLGRDGPRGLQSPVPDSARDALVLSGADGREAVSRDRGQSWHYRASAARMPQRIEAQFLTALPEATTPALPLHDIWSLRLDEGGRLWLLRSMGELWVSANGGRHWQIVPAGGARLQALSAMNEPRGDILVTQG